MALHNRYAATGRFIFPLLLFLYLIPGKSAAQKIEWLSDEKNVSLRGLSAITDQIIWVCGTGGTVARSTDGGAHWEWMTVKGFEKTDFRDIEAFDEQTAVLMGISQPAYLLRTEDGGQHWEIVYQDAAQGVFLDAMAFSGTTGYVVGDPLEGHPYLYMAETRDEGRSWTKLNSDTGFLFLEKGEALFASSGTNIVAFPTKKNNPAPAPFLTVTGGTYSSLLHSGSARKIPLPILQGRSSTGANSLAAWNTRQ
ncbi:MAG: WD40/YVTN/BNR-like repeat-containing protein, partial [Chitinophagaceae bacterium]